MNLHYDNNVCETFQNGLHSFDAHIQIGLKILYITSMHPAQNKILFWSQQSHRLKLRAETKKKKTDGSGGRGGKVYSQSSHLHCARSSLSPNWRPLILLSHSATHFQHPTLKMTWKNKSTVILFFRGEKKTKPHSGNFYFSSKEKENCFSLALKHKKGDAANQWCKEENPPDMRNNTSGGREMLLFFSAQLPREWWIIAIRS